MVYVSLLCDPSFYYSLLTLLVTEASPNQHSAVISSIIRGGLCVRGLCGGSGNEINTMTNKKAQKQTQ